ncbi:unnamed protein product, partial [Adineta ricciae]
MPSFGPIGNGSSIGIIIKRHGPTLSSSTHEIPTSKVEFFQCDSRLVFIFRWKNYVLHGELTENIWSTRFDLNADPTHHICVHRTSILDKPIDRFPYATKLTLCETFEVPRLPIVNDLNRAFPLRQLTNLSIQCHHFAFHQLIELFPFTTNVQTLTLDSIVLYRADASSIQRNEVFQSVSKANS